MQTLTPGSILGHAVRRREDPRLITGAGRYVDDIRPDGCLHDPELFAAEYFVERA